MLICLPHPFFGAHSGPAFSSLVDVVCVCVTVDSQTFKHSLDINTQLLFAVVIEMYLLLVGGKSLFSCMNVLLVQECSLA